MIINPRLRLPEKKKRKTKPRVKEVFKGFDDSLWNKEPLSIEEMAAPAFLALKGKKGRLGWVLRFHPIAGQRVSYHSQKKRMLLDSSALEYEPIDDEKVTPCRERSASVTPLNQFEDYKARRKINERMKNARKEQNERTDQHDSAS